MSVNGVALVMIWESAEEELRDNTALLHIQVILNFVVAPIRQVLSVIINLIVAMSSVQYLRG